MKKNRTKGIILAGGTGSRLRPVTVGVSKQLLPVYDKPMIYYPLTTLINAKIKDILIISTPTDLPIYKRLLGDGSQFGISFSYAIQDKPDGIAGAFLLAEDFVGNDSVCLILGDNILYGQDFQQSLSDHLNNNKDGCTIFGYEVSNPEEFGVATFNKKNIVTSLEEKPEKPKSNYAVIGLYLYSSDVIEVAKSLKPSKRGELEITDVNKYYLSKGKLKGVKIKSGLAWLDTGTHESLLEAGLFVNTIEKRQGIKVGCPEEAAFKNQWINKKQISKLAKLYANTSYGRYLLKISRKLNES